jgi:hypothetical protein
MIQYPQNCLKQSHPALGAPVTASTTKRVVVCRFDREPLTGYADPQRWLGDAGIELLSQEGALLTAPFKDIKLVFFVKDFDGDLILNQKRIFASRPKAAGLWIRAQFRDNDFIEGVMPNNLLETDRYGFTIVPPESSNNQRVFLPRAALREMRVLGVIGTARRARAEPERQIKLFD